VKLYSSHCQSESLKVISSKVRQIVSIFLEKSFFSAVFLSYFVFVSSIFYQTSSSRPGAVHEHFREIPFFQVFFGDHEMQFVSVCFEIITFILVFRLKLYFLSTIVKIKFLFF